MNTSLTAWPPFPAVLFGGDYNPEQWMSGESPDILAEDLRLMRLAHVNMVTVGVFSWSILQPDEQHFTFDWLDRVLGLLAEQKIAVCLATGTAAQPAWLSEAYPDVLPVTPERHRRQHGRRMNYCPTSPDFRRLSHQLVQRLAERYGAHPALALWHVSNEYGPECHCERCAARFREWLQERYGSLDEVNDRWVTAFWGHTYSSWEQIQPPGPLGENSIQGLTLDFRRFTSAMNLECFQGEAAILHRMTPHIPVATNFHGLVKRLDYMAWAPHQDIIAWDSYPTYDAHPSTTAFLFGLMRGLKSGQPWLLMEQVPNHVHWQKANPVKRPGVMRLQSYQALAYGANGAMFFQWRQSRGSAEMYHGAILGHRGSEETRVFHEVAALGKELASLDTTLLHTSMQARVAILFSWPSWWAAEDEYTPSRRLSYLDEVQRYYQALWQQNIAVDVVGPDQDLTRYDLIIAPLLNLVGKELGEAITTFVSQGGTFVTTYFSGGVDTDQRAWLNGAPGPLEKVLGLWVEEIDPLPPGQTNTIVWNRDWHGMQGHFSCDQWCEVIRLDGAQALGTFGQDFYAGAPAVTEHQHGAGRGMYIATRPDPAFLAAFVGALRRQLHLEPPLEAPSGVEITQRQGQSGTFTFVLNHSLMEQHIPLPQPMHDMLTGQVVQTELSLAANGVAILFPPPPNQPNEDGV